MNEEMVLPVPGEPWMYRLREGHYIWLVKEQEYAQVQWAWEPPEPGCCSGRLGIKRFGGYAPHQMSFWGEQTWFVDSMGKGFDGKQLIRPVEGNLPDNPPPIPAPIITHICTALAHLSHRISTLEANAHPGIAELLDDIEKKIQFTTEPYPFIDHWGAPDKDCWGKID
jgi:hypothetical protein